MDSFDGYSTDMSKWTEVPITFPEKCNSCALQAWGDTVSVAEVKPK